MEIEGREDREGWGGGGMEIEGREDRGSVSMHACVFVYVRVCACYGK